MPQSITGAVHSFSIILISLGAGVYVSMRLKFTGFNTPKGALVSFVGYSYLFLSAVDLVCRKTASRKISLTWQVRRQHTFPISQSHKSALHDFGIVKAW